MIPQLSILITSIPSRFDRAVVLYHELLKMIGDRNIEVLMLTDNRKRSIGEKREALKNVSYGKYFIFCDDDDALLDIEALYNATLHDVDVITSKTLCYNNDGSTFIVTHGLHNEVEHNTFEGRYLDCKRPPFPINAWHNRFKKVPFVDVSYGEDAVWSKMACAMALTEHYIDEIIYSYQFSPTISEAPTHSNPYWKNPNEESNHIISE